MNYKISMKNYLLNLFVIILCISCNDKNPYSKRNPIKEINDNFENISKTKTITLTYIIEGNKIKYHRTNGATLLDQNPKLKPYCIVTNTSDYGGVFKFYATLASQGNTLNFTQEKYISSGQTVEMFEEKEINPYTFESNVEVTDWGIIPPRKEVNK